MASPGTVLENPATGERVWLRTTASGSGSRVLAHGRKTDGWDVTDPLRLAVLADQFQGETRLAGRERVPAAHRRE